MKITDLSAEDQKLVNTEFSAELEKEAAEQVKIAQELYTTGFDKLASETADELDKLAEFPPKKEEEGEEKDEKKLDDEQKKEAATRGAFIAQGFIDGLKKLGQERHQDEMAYLYPFINEKLAGMGKVMDMAKNMGAKGMSAAKGMAAKAAPAAKDMAAKGMAVAKKPAVSHAGAAAGGAAATALALKMMGRKKEEQH